MAARRALLTATALGATIGTALAARPAASQTTPGSVGPAAGAAGSRAPLPTNPTGAPGRWRPTHRVGFGGQPISNGFGRVVPDAQAIATVDAAWEAGVRLYDTSPWYTLGRGERRLGTVLSSKPRDSFVISTKVGRVLEPDPSLGLRRVANWADAPSFRQPWSPSLSRLIVISNRVSAPQGSQSGAQGGLAVALSAALRRFRRRCRGDRPRLFGECGPEPGPR